MEWYWYKECDIQSKYIFTLVNTSRIWSTVMMATSNAIQFVEHSCILVLLCTLSNRSENHPQLIIILQSPQCYICTCIVTLCCVYWAAEGSSCWELALMVQSSALFEMSASISCSRLSKGSSIFFPRGEDLILNTRLRKVGYRKWYLLSFPD